MLPAYYQVIILLHVAFAGVFYFLNRQRPSRFARLFAWSWLIEGFRAAILLPVVHDLGGWSNEWYSVADVLCFFATWYLLSGCVDLAGVRLPRWLAPVYFLGGIPIVVFNRHGLQAVLETGWGVTGPSGNFYGILANLIVMFIPVAMARVAVLIWLFRIWKKTQLPGALVACVFCVPYAIVAIAVPIQHYYSYNPDWIALLWCTRVLGFSIGLVMLMLSLQQAAVAKSEVGLAAAQALAKIGSWELDLVNQSGTWSAEMFRLYGRAPADGVMSYEEFIAMIHPEDREMFRRSEARAIAERCSVEHEFRIKRLDGRVRWIHGRTTPFYGPTGKPIRIAGVEQDVTDRKRAESRERLQHAITRVLAEAQPLQPTMRNILEITARGLEADYAGFWTFDQTTRTMGCVELWQAPRGELSSFIELTRAAAYAEGVELPGRLLAERQPIFLKEADVPDDEKHPRREAALRAGLKSGSGFPILLRGEIFGVVEFFAAEVQQPDAEIIALFSAIGTQLGQFIERQRLEEQYRQSQKMEAVGTLAGGIAHDFNNILTGINGYCTLAQLETANNQTVKEYLDAVQEGANRAADLVRQIMTFSRQQEQKRTKMQLEAVVVEALKLLKATIPSTIEIKPSFGSDIFPVFADATSIHQIIVNLGTNAWHAMKDRTGRMEIALENSEVDLQLAALHPTLNPGSYVRLSISDTGHGMDQATLSRMFEPFFTTKPPGEGTGLGLAVVHGIVRNHDGTIVVRSRLGEGTTFDLYFPAYFGDIAPDAEAEASGVPRGNGERILCIDDEKRLAQMGKKILEYLGYQVEIHTEAASALRAMHATPEAYDLVITDLTMPGMTGVELARELLRIRVDIPIVLISGYTATLGAERLRAAGIQEVLMKPHSFDALGTVVHRVLSRNNPDRQSVKTKRLLDGAAKSPIPESG